MCSAATLASVGGLPAFGIMKTMSRVPRPAFTAAQVELVEVGPHREIELFALRGHWARGRPQHVEPFLLGGLKMKTRVLSSMKPLRHGAADAGSATGDDCNFFLQACSTITPFGCSIGIQYTRAESFDGGRELLGESKTFVYRPQEESKLDPITDIFTTMHVTAFGQHRF